MPDVNLSGSPLIKRPGDVKSQPAPDYNKKEQQKSLIQKELGKVLSDGVISDDEIVSLAKSNFTVEDVQNAFNWSLCCAHFSEDDRQKLTNDLMARIETYRQLNQEREGQEPTQFGL